MFHPCFFEEYKTSLLHSLLHLKQYFSISTFITSFFLTNEEYAESMIVGQFAFSEFRQLQQTAQITR